MPMTWPNARALAVCRIMLGIAVVLNAAEITAFLGRVIDGSLAMPAALGTPVTAGRLEAWSLVAVASGVFLMCGVLVREAALTASLTCLVAMLWDQQAYANHFFLTTLLVGYLAFAGSDATWSLRALIRKTSPPVTPVPVFLMVTQLSVCYLFAALSKVNPWWIAGDELQWSLRVEAPAWLYTPLAVTVILTELFIALGVWFQRTRALALLLGVGLHLSIVALMHDRMPLITFSIVCLSIYPLALRAPYATDLLRREPRPGDAMAPSATA